MPSAKNHQSFKYTKMLLMGDPGVGKTSSLQSLVLSGKKVFVLDFDNGLDTLIRVVREQNPDALDNLFFESIQDPQNLPGKPQKEPTGLIRTSKILTEWKLPERKDKLGNTLPAEDYGKPCEWGPNCVLVLDSLTWFGKQCLSYCQAKMPSKDGRMDYHNAQTQFMAIMQMLCSEEMQTNVICMAHVRFVGDEGSEIGYPNSIGSAISTTLGSLFNTMLLVKSVRAGNVGERFIHTVPDGKVCVKNAFPSGLKSRYPVNTGLAEIFQVLQS